MCDEKCCLSEAGVEAGVVKDFQQGTKRDKINFRDSCLTMLLKDSFGGNCKTTMLAMLSPSF